MTSTLRLEIKDGYNLRLTMWHRNGKQVEVTIVCPDKIYLLIHGLIRGAMFVARTLQNSRHPSQMVGSRNSRLRLFSAGEGLQLESVDRWLNGKNAGICSDRAIADDVATAANDNARKDSVDQRPSPLQRLEAVLFLSNEPISPRKLVALTDLADATEVRTLTRQLNEQYRISGNIFSIEEVAGGYLMLTQSQVAPWIKKFGCGRASENLSQSAIETLSIVAYRQPILRVDIESIRGVSCDDILRQLMERELVRIDGRSEELGRPFLYGTTKRFLLLFGLQSLEKLPRVEGPSSTKLSPLVTTAE